MHISKRPAVSVDLTLAPSNLLDLLLVLLGFTSLIQPILGRPHFHLPWIQLIRAVRAHIDRHRSVQSNIHAHVRVALDTYHSLSPVSIQGRPSTYENRFDFIEGAIYYHSNQFSARCFPVFGQSRNCMEKCSLFFFFFFHRFLFLFLSWGARTLGANEVICIDTSKCLSQSGVWYIYISRCFYLNKFDSIKCGVCVCVSVCFFFVFFL